MLDLRGLHLRAALLRFIRAFFYEQEFLEVDTPIRQAVYIPERNITPLASENEYLQASPELCMKRLLAAGCSRIFQICHCFRKEEKGRLHLEEFQMLEWYRTGTDYHQLMTDCENLLRFLLRNMNSLIGQVGTANTFGGSIFSGIKLEDRWERLTVEDAFFRYSPVKLEKALKNGIFDEILVEHLEPRLGFVAPVFLYDYPVELGSLAKIRGDKPEVAERFELYINGVELANGFSELTDAVEQRVRFESERAVIGHNTGRDIQMPERFLEDLNRLDVAAGIAMGIDRLHMIMLNRRKISEVVTFAPEDLVE